MADGGDNADVYDSEFVVLEGELAKLTAGMFGRQKWENRWVVITPTYLHIYKSAGQPRKGTKPKNLLYLGSGAHVEEVRPEEIDIYRPFTFSVVVPDNENETVLSAPSEERFDEVLAALGKQMYLTSYAEQNDLSLDLIGNMYNEAMEVVTTAADVLVFRDPPRAATIDALAGDDALSQYSDEAALITTHDDGKILSDLTGLSFNDGLARVAAEVGRTGTGTLITVERPRGGGDGQEVVVSSVNGSRKGSDIASLAGLGIVPSGGTAAGGGSRRGAGTGGMSSAGAGGSGGPANGAGARGALGPLPPPPAVAVAVAVGGGGLAILAPPGPPRPGAPAPSKPPFVPPLPPLPLAAPSGAVPAPPPPGQAAGATSAAASPPPVRVTLSTSGGGMPLPPGAPSPPSQQPPLVAPLRLSSHPLPPPSAATAPELAGGSQGSSGESSWEMQHQGEEEEEDEPSASVAGHGGAGGGTALPLQPVSPRWAVADGPTAPAPACTQHPQQQRSKPQAPHSPSESSTLSPVPETPAVVVAPPPPAPSTLLPAPGSAVGRDVTGALASPRGAEDPVPRAKWRLQQAGAGEGAAPSGGTSASASARGNTDTLGAVAAASSSSRSHPASAAISSRSKSGEALVLRGAATATGVAVAVAAAARSAAEAGAVGVEGAGTPGTRVPALASAGLDGGAAAAPAPTVQARHPASPLTVLRPPSSSAVAAGAGGYGGGGGLSLGRQGLPGPRGGIPEGRGGEEADEEEEGDEDGRGSVAGVPVSSTPALTPGAPPGERVQLPHRISARPTRRAVAGAISGAGVPAAGAPPLVSSTTVPQHPGAQAPRKVTSVSHVVPGLGVGPGARGQPSLAAAAASPPSAGGAGAIIPRRAGGLLSSGAPGARGTAFSGEPSVPLGFGTPGVGAGTLRVPHPSAVVAAESAAASAVAEEAAAAAAAGGAGPAGMPAGAPRRHGDPVASTTQRPLLVPHSASGAAAAAAKGGAAAGGPRAPSLPAAPLPGPPASPSAAAAALAQAARDLESAAVVAETAASIRAASAAAARASVDVAAILSGEGLADGEVGRVLLPRGGPGNGPQAGGFGPRGMGTLDDVDFDSRSIVGQEEEEGEEEEAGRRQQGPGPGPSRNSPELQRYGRASPKRQVSSSSRPQPPPPQDGGSVGGGTTYTALGPRLLRTMPLQSVRRLFDTFTAYSDGLLPLYRLPELAVASGLALPRAPGPSSAPQAQPFTVTPGGPGPQGGAPVTFPAVLVAALEGALGAPGARAAMAAAAAGAVYALPSASSPSASLSAPPSPPASSQRQGGGVPALTRSSFCAWWKAAAREARAASPPRTQRQEVEGQGQQASNPHWDDAATVSTLRTIATASTAAGGAGTLGQRPPGSSAHTVATAATEIQLVVLRAQGARFRSGQKQPQQPQQPGGRAASPPPGPGSSPSRRAATLAAVEAGLALTLSSTQAVLAELRTGRKPPQPPAASATDGVPTPQAARGAAARPPPPTPASPSSPNGYAATATALVPLSRTLGLGGADTHGADLPLPPCLLKYHGAGSSAGGRLLDYRNQGQDAPAPSAPPPLLLLLQERGRALHPGAALDLPCVPLPHLPSPSSPVPHFPGAPSVSPPSAPLPRSAVGALLLQSARGAPGSGAGPAAQSLDTAAPPLRTADAHRILFDIASALRGTPNGPAEGGTSAFIAAAAADIGSAAQPPSSGPALELLYAATRRLVAGSGTLGADPDSGPPSDWNSRYQALLELPEASFPAAGAKATALAALLRQFGDAAAEAAAVALQEELDSQASSSAATAGGRHAPAPRRTIAPLGDGSTGGIQSPGGAGSGGVVLYHRGMVIRLLMRVQGQAGGPFSPASLISEAVEGPEVGAAALAGHELRGTRAVGSAATMVHRTHLAAAATASAQPLPPRLATALSVTLDLGGIRVTATAVPPLQQQGGPAATRTASGTPSGGSLVYGCPEGPGAGPFAQRSPELAGLLRKAGRALNLKPHAAEVAAPGPGGRSLLSTAILPLGLDINGHACPDGRYYLVGLARCAPREGAPGPHGPGTPPLPLLRPELVRAHARPLSADAFRSGSPPSGIGAPPDAPANDVEAAGAVAWLLGAVIPAFVGGWRYGASGEAALAHGAGAPFPPLDSGSITTALHAAGINARHLGRVAEAAEAAGAPYLREAAEVEMVARAAKRLLRATWRRVCRQQRGLQQPLEPLLRGGALDLFNLVLGGSDSRDSALFWRDALLPVVRRLFGYGLANPAPGALHTPQLFFALQFHCGLSLQRAPAPPHRVTHPPPTGPAPPSGVPLGDEGGPSVRAALIPLEALRQLPGSGDASPSAASTLPGGGAFGDGALALGPDSPAGPGRTQRFALREYGGSGNSPWSGTRSPTALTRFQPTLFGGADGEDGDNGQAAGVGVQHPALPLHPGSSRTGATVPAAAFQCCALLEPQRSYSSPLPLPSPSGQDPCAFAAAAGSGAMGTSGAPEAWVAYATAEELAGRGGAAAPWAVREALRLRVSIQSSLGQQTRPHGPGSHPPWSSPASLSLGAALLELGQAHLEVGDLGAAEEAARGAIDCVCGLHLTAARGCLLLARCSLARWAQGQGPQGPVLVAAHGVRGLGAAMGLYGEAVARGSWHLGPQHPVLASFALTMATALAAAGLPGAAGQLLLLPRRPGSPSAAAPFSPQAQGAATSAPSPQDASTISERAWGSGHPAPHALRLLAGHAFAAAAAADPAPGTPSYPPSHWPADEFDSAAAVAPEGFFLVYGGGEQEGTDSDQQPTSPPPNATPYAARGAALQWLGAAVGAYEASAGGCEAALGALAAGAGSSSAPNPQVPLRRLGVMATASLAGALLTLHRPAAPAPAAAQTKKSAHGQGLTLGAGSPAAPGSPARSAAASARHLCTRALEGLRRGEPALGGDGDSGPPFWLRAVVLLTTAAACEADDCPGDAAAALAAAVTDLRAQYSSAATAQEPDPWVQQLVQGAVQSLSLHATRLTLASVPHAPATLLARTLEARARACPPVPLATTAAVAGALLDSPSGLLGAVADIVARACADAVAPLGSGAPSFAEPTEQQQVPAIDALRALVELLASSPASGEEGGAVIAAGGVELMRGLGGAGQSLLAPWGSASGSSPADTASPLQGLSESLAWLRG